MADKSGVNVFNNVKYFVTGIIPDNVRSILDEGGAQKSNFFSDMVTHCIVGQNPKETDISDAKDLYEVPAVTPYWVLLSFHCSKLLPTKGFIYDPRQVFHGLRMSASGLSSADYKALWAMVTFYGGLLQSSLNPDCTHLIASSASGAKYEAALNCPSVKIVTPDWVVDCIKAGRRSEEPYHPRYLVIPKPKEVTPPPPGDLSTAQILGFADDPPVGAISSDWSEQTPPPSTQALLEKLKQRMPWNKTGSNTPAPLPTSQQTPQTPTSTFVTMKTVAQPTTVVTVPPPSLPTSQPQPLQQPQLQPPQRMVPPQMLVDQTRTMLRPQQVQQLVGPQMKQYRLIHQPQQRIEVQSAQQMTLQGQQVTQVQQQPQQQLMQQGQQPQSQPQLIQAGQPGEQLQRPVTWAQGPPKQVQIQLDPQTHAQLSQMDTNQKMIFLQRIHQRQQLLLQQRHMQMQQQQQQQVQQQQQQAQQVQQQQGPPKQIVQQTVGPRPQQVSLGGVPMQMRQQQIIIRGISPQQQTAWLQQQQFIRQQQQQMLVQQGAPIRAPVAGRVIQQQTAAGTWVPQADHQIQRQHQLRMQPVVIQRAPTPVQQFTTVSPVTTATPHAEEPTTVESAPGGVGGGILVNNRTKTALANMLSSRLHTGHISPQPQVMGVADSAAGQLRLMSAQQRAAQGGAPENVVFSPGPGVQPVQRRALGNIANAGPKSPAPAPPVAVPPKPQFYTHNPSLRIPVDKYLIGCVFYIVEYDKSESPDVDISNWEEIIREHGGEVEANYTHRATHVLCETQKHGIVQQALRDGKRCVTAFWLNDVVSKGSLSVPWLALHFPVPFGREKPLAKYHMSLTGFEERAERQRVVMMIRAAGGQYRNYFSPATQILICKKPEGPKYRKAKELSKVTVNVQWLNEVLFGHYSCIHQPELHKYQQYNNTSAFRVDYALIPHLMAAWKMPISLTPEAYNAVKNSPPPVRRAKRPRLEPTIEQLKDAEAKILDAVPVVNIELLTMETRPWVAITGDVNLEFSKKAKQLGCFLVKSLSKITHLVICGKPVRTVKLLTCLVTCKYVVTQDWLADSAAQNKLLPEAPYIINAIDQDDLKCNVTRVITNPDRTNLFKDKIFYLTPNIVPCRRVLTEIIELCGGRVEKQRRSLKAIQELNRLSPTYFIISCYGDLSLISDVYRANMDFYSAELIMQAITTQTLDLSSAAFKYCSS